MEDLFSTNLAINNQHVPYKIVFDRDQYLFIPQGNNDDLGRFAFRRTHDEWVDQDQVPAGVRKQAIDALERYLLKQH